MYYICKDVIYLYMYMSSPQNITLYAACQRGQLDRIDMLLANSGADIHWCNPYYVSCLQVLDNVVSVSVMESTCVEVCYISESDPILMGQIL